MAKESVIVQRFEVGADATEKREFAQKLVAALDEVGVQPGEEFIVTTGDHLDKLANEIRDREEALVNHEAAVKDADDAIGGIQGIVEDHRLGLLDKDEMVERVKGYCVRYV